ncbi:MAG: lipoyl(octanoyl) transferase LipB [Pyrinomonadaceae bacterium]
MPEKLLHVRRLGRMDYGEAFAVQKEVERAVKSGAPDTLLLVEHPHVFTIGRNATRAGVLATTEMLAERRISVVETNRGGKVTYHGFGQIVGYPVINLSPLREDVHRYVRDLEEVLMLALGDFQIKGYAIKGLTGVHTERGKIAAIGVHISRWVTTHGFALNVNTDLNFYNLIVACEGEPVASMHQLIGRELALTIIEDRLIARFAEVFDMKESLGGEQL